VKLLAKFPRAAVIQRLGFALRVIAAWVILSA